MKIEKVLEEKIREVGPCKDVNNLINILFYKLQNGEGYGESITVGNKSYDREGFFTIVNDYISKSPSFKKIVESKIREYEELKSKIVEKKELILNSAFDFNSNIVSFEDYLIGLFKEQSTIFTKDVYSDCINSVVEDIFNEDREFAFDIVKKCFPLEEFYKKEVCVACVPFVCHNISIDFAKRYYYRYSLQKLYGLKKEFAEIEYIKKRLLEAIEDKEINVIEYMEKIQYNRTSCDCSCWFWGSTKTDKVEKGSFLCRRVKVIDIINWIKRKSNHRDFKVLFPEYLRNSYEKEEETKNIGSYQTKNFTINNSLNLQKIEQLSFMEGKILWEIRKRGKEIENNMMNDSYFSAYILAFSVLEALIIEFSNKKLKMGISEDKPISEFLEKVKKEHNHQIAKSTLSMLVGYKDIRNHVHIHRSIKEPLTVEEHTVKTLFDVINAIVKEMLK